MFILRVHSVDVDHPLVLEEAAFSTVSTTPIQSNPTHNPEYSERRGVVHLYRNASQSSLPNPSSRSTSLFIVAVPNYLSADDFIRFCESHIDKVHELLFIRNDGMEDRYSVLIKLSDQVTADGFYGNFNGKRFSPGEAEICHILFVLNVDYTEAAEIASTPPAGFTELPTCPICLERLDPDTSGILSTLCDHSFQCSCTSKWTYLSCQVCRLCQQQDEIPVCSVCGTSENLWVCIICGFVGCGRYKEQHAIRHWQDTQHFYSLDLRTQQIWDYVGDNYVHRLNQSKADGKLVDMNSRCMSLEGDYGTCGCSEDSGINGALFSSKVETIVDEYNRLLANQLEAQRQVSTEYPVYNIPLQSLFHPSLPPPRLIAVLYLYSWELFYNCCFSVVYPNTYGGRLRLVSISEDRTIMGSLAHDLHYESLIADVKSKRESSIQEVVDKAVTSTMQDIQTKLEKCEQEKDAVAEVNRSLIKNQEIWRRKVKEVEEREASSLRSRDERILDLEEQIRDLTVYIEAQKTLNNMTDTNDIRGGTLLPVPSKQSSPANNKRHTKPGRRRT